MVETSDRKRFPLRLCEVLEQEFAALHHPVIAGDWLLRPCDLNVPALTHKLLDSALDAAQSPVKAIRQRLDEQQLDLPDRHPWPGGFARPLCDALNKLLRDPRLLYEPQWLEPKAQARQLSRQRLATPEPAHDGLPHPGGEHVQLNRLLLEAALSASYIARADDVRLDLLIQQVHQLPQTPQPPLQQQRELPFEPPPPPQEPPAQPERGKPLLRSALCLSGGGIRSAAFALGGVQALACKGVLDKFDYLSTVSGGGYLGSWLSSWVHRHPQLISGVSQELRASVQHHGDAWESKLKPEARPLRFLRSYSNFLNPRAGLFSVDTWTWVGLYVRNLCLNWLVLLPLLMLLLMLPRLFGMVTLALGRPAAAHDTLGWGLMALASVMGVAMVLCAIVNRPSATDTARRVRQTAQVRPAARNRRERLLRRLKQPAWIAALGIGPLLVFAASLAWLAWGRRDQLPGLLLRPPWLDGPLFGLLAPSGALPMLAWVEGMVFTAWLLSWLLLPRHQWWERLGSLGAMLAAGLSTWLVLWLLERLFSHWHLPSGPCPSCDPVPLQLLLLPLHTVLAVPAVVLAVLAGLALFIGLLSKWPWVEDEDREWWARFGACALICVTTWAVLAAAAVLGPMLLFKGPDWGPALGGISGLVAVLLGKSALTPASLKSAQAAKATSRLAALGRLAAENTTALLGTLFLAVFLALLSLLNSALLLAWLDTGERASCGFGTHDWRDVFMDGQLHALVLSCRTWALARWALVAMLVLVLGGGLVLNLNKLSLHEAYRIRVARTFLGASRGPYRKPNSFTDFDPLDNVKMHELQPGLLREVDLANARVVVDWLRCALRDDPPQPLESLIGARLHDPPQSRSPEILAAAVRELASRLCAPAHDPDGQLRDSLLATSSQATVLASLVQLLLEKMNRVLQSERFDLCPALSRLLQCPGPDGPPDPVRKYVDQGQHIFANRMLLERVFPQLLSPFKFPPPPPHKLMHVINLTLNLARGRNLAWQERKAAPFTVSPMHSGTYYLGYRASRDYGDGISIATAAAVSGAAVSPNRGYSSSPLTALLLTLFNVRLGWWLGNPGAAGGNPPRQPWIERLRGSALPPPYRREEPFFSLHPLVSEALGHTDDTSRYVYLSDGGHFENLGLYEMVLRRCHFIVVFDAGADPDYEHGDLGNAVRKIRIDMGIPIEVEPLLIRKRKGSEDHSGRYCAIGRIDYARVDGRQAPQGLLLYFKPVLCGGEPRDVQHYANEHEAFPQESTSDQFFGEAQFESYRQLGQWAVEQALWGDKPNDVGWAADLVCRARDHIRTSPAWKYQPLQDQWLADWLDRFRQCH